MRKDEWISLIKYMIFTSFWGVLLSAIFIIMEHFVVKYW